jgi:hypothetical protein
VKETHVPNATKEPDVADTGPPPPPQVTPFFAGDAPAAPSSPLILNDAYFELSGINLRCNVKHLECAFPENKLVTITSLCTEYDTLGITKWHLRVTFYQDFSSGGVFATLTAAINNYVNTGTLVPWKARPRSSLAPSATNPTISGLAVPQPIPQIFGDAGAASEVQIDWNMPAAPAVDYGSVAATGATAGAPGYFTPTGAQVPANLAALAGVVAAPAANWAAGQYVITADLLAANWNGSAWVVGKHP